jgi:uncharacterized protein YqeY
MSLKQTLKTDLTTAMKARDELTVSTLRMTLAAIMNAEVAGTAAVTLTDDKVLAVLRSEAKKRSESAEIYEQNGRAESATKERAEAEIIARYLPAAMNDAALSALVADEVAKAVAAGHSGPKAMGGVIKAVRERAGSDADGARISAAVKAALA